MPFFGGSKSSSTSYSTEQGVQSGDDSLVLNLSGSTGNTFSTDTPAALKYLTGTVGEVSENILDASLDASLGLQEAAKDASRRQTDTASQLNLSLSEGIKELNLRSTETKAATTTARNLLIAAVVAVLAIALFLRKPAASPAPLERKTNASRKKSK